MNIGNWFRPALTQTGLATDRSLMQATQAGAHPVVPFSMIAHRGFAAQFPEDTEYAAVEAMKLGALPECDVQFTLDGEMVVIHDDCVDRTTNGTGRVCDLPYVYIASLDAGSYMSKEFSHVRIPTFKKYLKAVKKATRIYPEIKSYRTEADVAVFTKMVLKYGFEEKAVIQSFAYPTVLPLIRKMSQKVCVGALCSTQEQFDFNITIAESDPNSEMLISQKIATRENLERCRSGNVDVAVWTVKTKEEMMRLFEIGYDKLMLNEYMTVENEIAVSQNWTK